MKAPPGHVEPITAARLAKIIVGLGYPVPPDQELDVMAAVFTGMQSCNDPVQWDDPNFEVREYDEYGRERLRLRTRKPVWLRLKSAIGLPRRREKDWSDLMFDIAARFRQAIRAVDPDLPLGDRDGPSQALSLR
jgi:hypothetical protein